MVAGEGYGKTYAAASFLRGRSEQVIWVQFSDRDNSPGHFWEDIAKAAGYRNQMVKKTYMDIGFPETPREVYRYLETVEKLGIGRQYIIVFDDLHLIHARPVLTLMEQVLSSPIIGQNFVLISRSEPEINTIPLLSKGRLSRIGADDLRFTKEETEAFFSRGGITVSPEELNDIHRDTEGWALAVNVLSGELKKRDGKRYTRQLLNTGAVRALIDRNYGRMNARLQKFLVQISLFEQWPREVLEKIAQDKNIITEMEHLSSLIRYDAYLHGYHIHRIVLDFLKEKQGELSAADIQSASTLAAEWCLANNLPMTAALHYVRARNYRELIHIVFTFRPVMPRRTAEFFLDLVDGVTSGESGDNDDEDILFLRHVMRPRLLMVMRNLEKASSECRAAIARFEAMPPSPLSFHILTGAYINLGDITVLTARYTGNHNAADCFIRANYYYMRHPRNFKRSTTQVNLPSYVCQVAYPARPGEIEEAIRSFIRAVPHAVNCFNGYLYGLDDLAWTEFAYFRDDLDSAEQYARRAAFKARKRGQYEIENRALFFLLRISLHKSGGNTGEIWRQLDAQLHIDDYLNRGIIHDIISGWFYAHIQEGEKVGHWLKNDFDDNDINSAFHIFELLVRAKYLFASGHYNDIFAIIARKEYKPGQGHFLIEVLEMTCLEAASRRRTGDRPGALRCLEKAWEAAASNALTMPFIEMGDDMRLLVSDAINGDNRVIPRDWLESIRSRASAYGKRLAAAAAPYRQDAENRDGGEAAVYLTRRERKILTLLSQGFTRDEIARETDRPEGSIKNSIHTIYHKLRALNRADAIRIATKMGLLP